MSETDLERVVGELLDAGCVLIPDEPSTRPEAHEIVSLEAFRICRQGRRLRLFFAVSSEWGVAPFEWGKIEKNGATQYFIRQKTGGPTLDIFAPFPFETPDGRTTLPHGFIACHSTFWNPLTNRAEKPPVELKAMHKLLVQTLRSEGGQLQGKRRTYLIARGAKESLRAGYVLGPPFDNSNSGSQ